MTNEPSLQERYAPHNACFGCGPANAQGLRIRSFARDDGTWSATFTPAPHHEAFPGVLNGGIIGALLDCHMNWAAAHHLMQRDHAGTPPCTVTAEFSVRLQRPTPSAGPVELSARVVESAGARAVMEATLTAAGRVCATGRGTFVAVEPGHPAYHRW
jgi:acyl-coenzyme A thioesterase PaaI-like protein